MIKPEVSLVCVTMNRASLLKKCLDSCISQTLQPREIIVVDNASSDDTVPMLQRDYPGVHLIRLHRNIGFFPALNIAIANTSGDLIFTIDDDAYFQEQSALKKMAHPFKVEPELQIATCNIEGPSEAPPLVEDSYVHGFKTGFALIRASVFRETIGFYPDLFFRSGGEAYLATKVWDSGGRVKQLATVRMYHHQAIEGRITRDWLFYGTRSQVLLVFMREHWIVLPARLFSKFAKGLIHVVRKRASLLTWLHAWLSAFLYLPEALRNRDAVSYKTARLLTSLRKDPSTDPPL